MFDLPESSWKKRCVFFFRFLLVTLVNCICMTKVHETVICKLRCNVKGFLVLLCAVRCFSVAVALAVCAVVEYLSVLAGKEIPMYLLLLDELLQFLLSLTW